VVRPTSGSSPDRVGEVDEETGTEQCCGRWVSLERYYCLERRCPESAALTFHTRHSVGCDSVCNRVGGFGATPAVTFLIRIPTKGTELNGATPTRSRTRSAPAVDPGQSVPKALPRPDGVVAHRGNAATNLKTLTDLPTQLGEDPNIGASSEKVSSRLQDSHVATTRKSVGHWSWAVGMDLASRRLERNLEAARCRPTWLRQRRGRRLRQRKRR
jgi:hypothetical protein